MTPSQTLAPTSPKVRLAWPHLILAILGFGVSIYAIWAHNVIAAGGDAGCGITETISCDKVLSSKWAKFAGIPLGYFGCLYWILVGLSAINTGAPNLNWERVQRFGLASVGIVCSAFLFYVSEFLIRKICPICLATHILSLLNFLFASVALWKNRGETRDWVRDLASRAKGQ